MALAEPSGLMQPYVTLTVHGLTWHLILIFIGLYCHRCGLAGKSWPEYAKTLPLLAVDFSHSASIINVATHGTGRHVLYLALLSGNPGIFLSGITARGHWRRNRFLYLLHLPGWVDHPLLSWKAVIDLAIFHTASVLGKLTDCHQLITLLHQFGDNGYCRITTGIV